MVTCSMLATAVFRPVAISSKLPDRLAVAPRIVSICPELRASVPVKVATSVADLFSESDSVVTLAMTVPSRAATAGLGLQRSG